MREGRVEIEVDLVDLEVELSAESCGTRQEVWREELHQLRRHLKSVVVVLTAGRCLSPRKMSLRLRSPQRRRTKKSRSLQSR